MCFATAFTSCATFAWSTILYDYCAILRFIPCITGF